MEPEREAPPLVHSYDVERHGNRCGAPGQTSSTKYRNGVSCPDCLRELGREPPPAVAPANDAGER